MAEQRSSIVPPPDLMADDAIDRATVAMYQQICSAHREFIENIETSAPPDLRGEKPCIVIMPGAFHGEHRHTGADGQRVVDLASQLGWPVKRVPVPSLAPMAANAAALVEFLSRRRGQAVILVSLSKGGADVRSALQRPAAASELQDVRTWLNLSGMVYGTPLVAWLRARPLRCCGVRLLLRFRGQRFADVNELRHGDGAPLNPSFVLPPHLNAIHVIGFPLQRHLSNDWARRGHARLTPLGPNDGGGIMLRDVARLPGDVYPVWGADHYLQPAWDVRPLLLRILQEAALPAATIQPATG